MCCQSLGMARATHLSSTSPATWRSCDPGCACQCTAGHTSVKVFPAAQSCWVKRYHVTSQPLFPDLPTHTTFLSWTHKMTKGPQLKPFLQRTAVVTEHCGLLWVCKGRTPISSLLLQCLLHEIFLDSCALFTLGAPTTCPGDTLGE